MESVTELAAALSLPIKVKYKFVKGGASGYGEQQFYLTFI